MVRKGRFGRGRGSQGWEGREAKDGVPVLKPMAGEGLRPEGPSKQEAE